jgi:hypothetical protein
MAIANSDGSIVLTTKIDTGGVGKALDIIKNKFSALKDQRTTIASITEAIKMQKERLQELNKEYAQRVASGQAGTSELKEEIELETKALKELEQAAATLGKKSTKSFDDMSKGLKKFGKRIAGIIKSALVFSVLYKVMQAVVKLFQNILMSDEEFRQDWEELKAAFYTAAYPIVNLIVPAIKYIVQQVRDWAVSIGKVAAALQGMSYSELVDQAKASKEAADNYADMEKSSKKTADNVKKQLAGFDDIQILSSGNDSEDGAGIAGFEGLKGYDTSGEKSVLDDLMTAIGGALAAVGLILLFKGQISWGVGFLVAGAAFWAIGEIWGEDYDPSSATDILSNIMETIGVSLAAIGIILLTKGVVAWGIGFLVAGAAIWAITEFAEGEFSTDPIVNTLVKIMGIAGTALLALGVILCVFGQINPISIGMIVAGAASLVAAVGLSQDAIVEAIRGPIGVITAIVSTAFIVLGVILLFTGAGIPMGLGLILAGASSLATVVAVNWNAITDAIKGTFNSIIEWIENNAMLIIGIVLTLIGMFPLGIALIIGSIKAKESGEQPSWNYLTNKVKEIFTTITTWVQDNAMLIIGIVLVLIGMFPLGIALILESIKAKESGEAPSWNYLTEKVTKIFTEVTTWIENNAMLLIGIVLLLIGMFPLGIALILGSIEAKESGEEPSWDYLTKKVKEIWEGISSFWNKNIAPIFTKKWWEDLGKTCINGLISGFEGGINGIITAFESMINWIVDGLNKISFDIPDWLGGGHFGINIPRANFGRVSIPRLAKGAVIPPNREFLAVLGDQKQGTNIEAPLQTIVDAFNIALQSNANYGGGNTEVVLEIDGREFGRAVVEQGNRENRRIGTRLVIG